MATRKKICLKANLEDEKSKRRIMKSLAGIEGVESVAVDMKEGKITVIGDADPVYLTAALRRLATFAELVSVGPAKPEEFEAKKAGKKEGSNWDTENRGANHYLGVQKEGSNWDTENRGANHYLGVQRAEAVGGFGGMNPAIEDNEGSKTWSVEAVEKAVAGFGDFSSIQVDIKKGMVTVVGKSVPVRVALKVREMGYRAKLLSLGPATEEEDPDEDLYPNHPSTTRNERYPYPYTYASTTSNERYPYTYTPIYPFTTRNESYPYPSTVVMDEDYPNTYTYTVVMDEGNPDPCTIA